MPGWRLQYPFVEGEIDESKGVVPSDAVERSATFRKFNLDETTRVESFKLSAGKVAGLSAGGFVGAMLILAALLAAACSCPTVYVVDGPQETIVGQAYPGAIFRSVQREDLLPLPRVDGSTLTLRLRNENPEIQYTDWASLAIVEHAPEQRALATHDGHPVIVNGSQAPRQVVDLNGQDVSDRLRAIDDQVWQSDLDGAFRSGRRELREELVATFERPLEGPLALEITAESTLWMSVVFHRGLTMMGSAFGAVVHAANQADRAGIDAWRAREGVDLTRDNLREIVQGLRARGVAQIFFTGGEPLRRATDLLYACEGTGQSIDCWVVTSGVGLSTSMARQLAEASFTGVVISVDHWSAERHDAFRGRHGAFDAAMSAAAHATANGLAVAFSICPTREFVTRENLERYAVLARSAGASFIQIMEPRAIGHYLGRDILLSPREMETLEAFSDWMNFDPANEGAPIVTYPALYQRRYGCLGAAEWFLYLDTNGDAHACPFCRSSPANVVRDGLDTAVRALREQGCPARAAAASQH